MKCCICGKEIIKFSECNNPYPISNNPKDVCCDFCNIQVVIPARIAAYKEGMINENID